MNPLEQEAQTAQIVDVRWSDRWQIYLRLRELGIPCWCAMDQPLRVQIDTAAALIQIWSVIRQVSTPRQVLVNWFEECWRVNHE